jgi:hypothetical protein
MTFMSQCPFCQKEISENAKNCQHCGKRLRWKLFEHPLVIIAVIICSAICFGYFYEFTKIPYWIAGLLSIFIAIGLIALLCIVAD